MEQCRLLGSLLSFSHFPCYPQAKGSFLCWFPGGWICVCSRTLWFSPTNSPVTLGISPTTTTPTDFYRQRFWGFLFTFFNLDFTVSLPSCSSRFNRTQMWGCSVCQPLPCCASSPPWLPVSAPPTSLNECFFFNSLFVGLPYSSLFWQFWLFFCV